MEVVALTGNCLFVMQSTCNDDAGKFLVPPWLANRVDGRYFLIRDAVSYNFAPSCARSDYTVNHHFTCHIRA